MHVIVTLRADLGNPLWGWDDLLQGADPSQFKQLATSLIQEDIGAVLDSATWDVEVIDD